MLQPGLIEPSALKGARSVLRGGGGGDISSLPDVVVYFEICLLGVGTLPIFIACPRLSPNDHATPTN